MSTHSYLHELDTLEDIGGELVFEDDPRNFTDEHAVELVETAFHLMEEYMAEHPNAVNEPGFHDTMLEEIKEMFYIQLEDHILHNDYLEEDMNDLLEDAFDIYMSTFHPDAPPRVESDDENSESDSGTDDEEQLNALAPCSPSVSRNYIMEKIERLRQLPQPAQRTPEWYLFRWNLITASNAWKAFESQSAINSLIYEKCQPLKDFSVLDDEPPKAVNVNTTLHWGQKYEPLSVMYYEHVYESSVEDFGCIRHPDYSFIGASPDGIVVESNASRFGRMLEIKNIVNREITGIPKKEYWVQMQLQMEVCDLDTCDFLETKFEEYSDYTSYLEDADPEAPLTKTRNGKWKGQIIHFHKSNGAPHYEYMPLALKTAEEIDAWREEAMAKYESPPFNYMFMRFLYWKLEKVSCVLVQRSRDWFKRNVGQLAKVWKIIEQERVSGYEHRAPNRRVKKEPATYTRKEDSNDVCFLKVVKMDG